MLYILILVISGIAQLLGPWWLMPIVCFGLCFWKAKNAKEAYGIAFAAVSTLWLGYSLFQSFSSAGTFPLKVAEIFKLPNAASLFAAVTLVGGLVAGFAGLAGHYCRLALKP